VDVISEKDQLLISSIIGSKTRDRFSLAMGSCVKQRRSIVCPEKDETMNSSGLLGSRRGSPESSASVGSSGEDSAMSQILASSAPYSASGNSDFKKMLKN
jgi:hypothetical protein